jgi:hypothetical protein
MDLLSYHTFICILSTPNNACNIQHMHHITLLSTLSFDIIPHHRAYSSASVVLPPEDLFQPYIDKLQVFLLPAPHCWFQVGVFLRRIFYPSMCTRVADSQDPA